ncbi:hypothetical protein ACFWY5_57770 [Nonomuraea sp. NPDC059007]|uniref:hypothetical protein n=1 Tax=Nonomuraea sp. NPDC059007 TaxID=3346692 RepID=UPI0036A5CF1B
MRHVARCAMTAVPLIVLTACSAPDKLPTPAPAAGLTADQVQTVERAREELIRRCLTRQGFTYVLTPWADPRETRVIDGVLDDITWAQTYGYGGRIRAKAMAYKRDNPNSRYLKTLTAKQRERFATVLYGTPGATLSVRIPSGPVISTSSDGCLAEADSSLYGDFKTWFRVKTITDNLAPRYLPQVYGDARFHQAVASWATCMREAGFGYTSPSAIRARLASLKPAEEIRLATAEARCALATPLAGTIRDLKRHYGGIVRRPYEKEITTRKQMESTALMQAQKIVTTSKGVQQ